MSSAPPIEGAAYLGAALATLYFWGIPADADTPPMVAGSFELSGVDGSVTLDVFEGPPGVPGEPSPIVKMQYSADITDPGDLPINLLDNDIDIGKAYWVGNNVYVWMGTGWYVRQMGVAGPPGPVPIITPSIQIVESGQPDSLTVPAKITKSGTDLYPGWLIQFDHDSVQGPVGPASLMRGASDYDNTIAPTDGEAIIWSSAKGKYVPGSMNVPMPTYYSVPEGNFQNYLGLGTAQQIGSFQVPQQNFAWKPLVFGHFKAQGVDLTVNPLIIGVEVLLGDPTAGQRVGRGFGNPSNMAHVLPHFSSPTSPSTAITPDNSTALVSAYHTGTQGTLYIRLYNDGAPGEYSFDATNAQLIVCCMPVSGYVTPPGS